jgi:hypothetical protein
MSDPKQINGDQKTPMWLLPPVAKVACARVLALGATKYGPWNWRKTKVRRETYISAIHRHIDAWQEGQALDPESGESHLAHVMANCCILLDALQQGTLIEEE